MTKISNEHDARAAGFTKRIEWDSLDGFGGLALAKPDADLEGDFLAFCLEDNEMLTFHGWAIDVESAA